MEEKKPLNFEPRGPSPDALRDVVKRMLQVLYQQDHISLDLCDMLTVALGLGKMRLGSMTDCEVLREFLNRLDEPAATSVVRHGVWHTWLIEIGSDECAEIIMTDDALKALRMAQ